MEKEKEQKLSDMIASKCGESEDEQVEDQSNEFESSPEGSVSIVNVDEDGRRDNRDEDEGDDLDDTELF